MTGSLPAVEASGLGFVYGREPVFSDVGFAVPKGCFAAFIGANGAGKSTLLRLMLGDLAPSSGTIRVFGAAPRSSPSASIKGRAGAWGDGGPADGGVSPAPRVGYLAQNGAARIAGFPATALEAVSAGLYALTGRRRLPGRQARDMAMDALSLTGMAGEAGKLLGNLSGGQRQRVLLARVLAAEPDLLLLDEPGTGVDARSLDAIVALLARLAAERCVTSVMVTHNIGQAADAVSRVFCLEEGSLVELDKEQLGEELAHKHKHPAPRR